MNDLQNENPNYYAIIPANVRYDNTLRDKAKLLYGEITSLCQKEGYCWASNSYFSKLYGVSKTTISTLIKELADRQYVSIEMIKKQETNEIDYRKIYINPIKENLNTYLKNFKYPIKEDLKGNNKNIIININNKENINKRKKEFVPPTLEEVKEYIAKKSYNVDGEVFHKWYTDRNWKDSNNRPVKNWKGKVITWHNNADSKPKNSNFTSRKYDNLNELFMNQGENE